MAISLSAPNQYFMVKYISHFGGLLDVSAIICSMTAIRRQRLGVGRELSVNFESLAVEVI